MFMYMHTCLLQCSLFYSLFLSLSFFANVVRLVYTVIVHFMLRTVTITLGFIYIKISHKNPLMPSALHPFILGITYETICVGGARTRFERQLQAKFTSKVVLVRKLSSP